MIADVRAEDLVWAPLPRGTVNHVLPIGRQTRTPDMAPLEGKPLKPGMSADCTARPGKVGGSEGRDSAKRGNRNR